MGLLDSLAKQVLKRATITRVAPIAHHTYHLTLQGPDLANLNYKPGQTLNVFFDLSGPEAALRKRTYSIWQYDAKALTLELAVCTFSNGPGARWAQHCRPGDEVYFNGPGGKFVLDATAASYCLLGDVSTLSHLYALRRQIPQTKPVFSLVHVQSQDDCFPDLDGSYLLHFAVADQLSAPEVLAAVAAQGLRSATDCLYYIGGAQEFCVETYQLLRKQWQVPTAQLKAKPFWK
ncbi:siderophore-interacting protein [Hymenobacter sp. YC55]|uniref:siderophore-interacting protein n=1 Tax=Hymenobacter sp. YC55 TaxID=3034019 RepID=UPI0023F884F7|nr:siderophore-interacting protein [Hymenobacter sp. YC55]MDF7812170.1 siderophore-interacting protein [Hymenobacter sp. YC55]